MARTITVKGTGRVRAKPDLVVLSMTLVSADQEYGRAMASAADAIARLNDALTSVGFEQDAVKTTDFNVHTRYEQVRDPDGSYRSVFDSYEVVHGLKCSFDLDMERLSKALSAVAGCLSHPQISIAFTVKDPAAIHEELLRSAAENARRKAEVLCSASGVELDELRSIIYDLNRQELYSRTCYQMEDNCLPAPGMARAIEMEPDDISVSDSATFIWKIK